MVGWENAPPTSRWRYNGFQRLNNGLKRLIPGKIKRKWLPRGCWVVLQALSKWHPYPFYLKCTLDKHPFLAASFSTSAPRPSPCLPCWRCSVQPTFVHGLCYTRHEVIEERICWMVNKHWNKRLAIYMCDVKTEKYKLQTASVYIEWNPLVILFYPVVTNDLQEVLLLWKCGFFIIHFRADLI